MVRFHGFPLMLMAVSLLTTDAAMSLVMQGEHQRRFAVELRLIAGDLRRIRQEELPPKGKAGIEQRIAGSLAYLALLGRQAIQERDIADSRLLVEIGHLREAFDNGQLDAMVAPLTQLLRRYPLVLAEFDTDSSAGSRRYEIGRDIDRRLCQGCHLHPDSQSLNPAPDLFRDARTMPSEEFAARLMGGIRGTPATGLANPFTEEELRGLYVWYKKGAPVGWRMSFPQR